MESAGLSYDKQLIRFGEFTDESGAQAMRDLLNQASPPPTAVFAASDIVALGAMSVIQEAGLRVPEDISVVGFDDIPLVGFVNPPLTTIHLPAYDLGWSAGDLLARLIEVPDTVRRTQLILGTKFILRQSTAALR